MMLQREKSYDSQTSSPRPADAAPATTQEAQRAGIRANGLIDRAVVGRSPACRAKIHDAALGLRRLTVGELTCDRMDRDFAAEVVSFLNLAYPATSRPAAPPVHDAHEDVLGVPMGAAGSTAQVPTPAAKAMPQVPRVAKAAPMSAQHAYAPVPLESREELAAAKWPAPDLGRDRVEEALGQAADTLTLRQRNADAVGRLAGAAFVPLVAGPWSAGYYFIMSGITAGAVGMGLTGGAVFAGGVAAFGGLVAAMEAGGDISMERGGPNRLGPATLLCAKAVASRQQADAVYAALRAHGVLHPEDVGHGATVVDLGPLREALMAPALAVVGLTPIQRSRVEKVVRYVYTTAASRLMASHLAQRAAEARVSFDLGLITADDIRAVDRDARQALSLLQEQKEMLTWPEASDLP